MIYIQVRDPSLDRRAPWTELPESPHTLARSELIEARKRWRAEAEANPGVFGAGQAPQTTAREILGAVAPGLHGFDLLILGFAVTATSCRVGEAADGPWERLE